MRKACPMCGATEVVKSGVRVACNNLLLQRFLCKNCGLRFSEKGTNSPSNHCQYKRGRIGDPYRVSVSKTEMKNLDVELSEEKGVAGTTKNTGIDDATTKQIFEYAWALKKNGYAEQTILTYVNLLKTVATDHTNLLDIEAVKGAIVKRATWGPGRRNNCIKAYRAFLKMHGMKAELPRFKVPRELPFIPSEAEIDALAMACPRQIGIFIQLLKETGARRGEAFSLTWTDIDLANRTVKIKAEKGGNARLLRLSENLAMKMGTMPKTGERVFKYKSAYHLERGFRRARKRIAYRLSNPRLLKIHFHTMRHFRATYEYYRTRDIYHVMRMLGHRNIENTLLYVQLVEGLFPDSDESYVCKVANSADEAKSLIESGFEYVTGDYADGGKLFRKKKALYLGAVENSKGP